MDATKVDSVIKLGIVVLMAIGLIAVFVNRMMSRSRTERQRLHQKLRFDLART
jgi:hypothetical protein